MILAIDQGTSSTKAVLVADGGRIVAKSAAPVSRSFPHPGWIEQDGEEIFRSVLSAAGNCLQQSPDASPSAIALSTQRESAVAWHRDSGLAAGPVIGWQDRRTSDRCRSLEPQRELIRSKTGLDLNPMFSAPKLRWLLDEVGPSDVCVGTLDAFLIYRLTGGTVYATEAGNASRTLLMDIEKIAWDREMLELFEIPIRALPEIRGSDADFGTTVACGPIPSGLPIAAVLADSHAALYAHGAVTSGTAKATFGTGSSVMSATPQLIPVPGAVSLTLAWLTDKPMWALEGNILASGAALDWMASVLGVRGGSELAALARSVDGTDGVAFVPAFSGLGAPHWDSGARATIDGMTLGTRPGHLARAAFEAVANQVCDVIDAIDAVSLLPVSRLHADGGASSSDLLMQIQADLAGRAVIVSSAPEMSALGVAGLAGSKIEGWALADATAQREFRPHLEPEYSRAQRTAWATAVSRCRSNASNIPANGPYS